MKSAFADIHELLRLDAEEAVGELTGEIRRQVRRGLARGGVVLGLSGGIDSSLVAKLCAMALGPEHVLGVLMPERESHADTLELSRLAAQHLGIRTVEEDITGILEACGCYRRRDEAIRSLIPDYGPGHVAKLTTVNLLDVGHSQTYFLVVRSPGGEQTQVEPPPHVLRAVIAATSFKQRARKMLEYHHADLNRYAVAGTPNRLEYELGFFVKNGDGAADLKPIAHLYKSQVYQLARHLGLPHAILEQPPSTDTYSMHQSQEEFYFAMPLPTLDLCLFCRNTGRSPEASAEITGLTVGQVKAVFADIVAKRAMAKYLHAPPLTPGTP